MEIANKKKMTIVLFIMLILFSAFNPVLAAINDEYNVGKEVEDDDLDTKVKDSVVLDALATLAYSIGSMVENLVGKAFAGLTGNNVFPWADRVLFNALPMLDVNIFNPAEASLFKTKTGDVTPLARIVRNTYFTILTLTVAFLTIVIGIAAVKLAISSIASDKAKYKEAVVKWLFSIVLIFLMHNVISFVLWMNEEMVKVASSLLNKSLLKGNLELLNESLSIGSEKALENFLTANKSNLGIDDDEVDYINNNSKIAYRFLINTNYTDSVLFDAFGDASHSKRNWWKELFTSNGFQSMQALKRDIEFINSGSASIKNDSKNGGGLVNVDAINQADSLNITIDGLNEALKIKDEDQLKQSNEYLYFVNHIAEFTGQNTAHAGVSYFKKYARAMISVDKYINGSKEGSEGDNTPNLMASLGQYFKESAYVVPTDDDSGEITGWHRSKLTITGALLYAIFVFQSLFYFFAYIRRFFYIVILIIMAPVIVLLDFLRKALV